MNLSGFYLETFGIGIHLSFVYISVDDSRSGCAEPRYGSPLLPGLGKIASLCVSTATAWVAYQSSLAWFFPSLAGWTDAQLCYSIGSWDHESCVTMQRTYLHIMESHPVALSNDADQFLHRRVPARPVVNCLLDCRRKINKDLRCMYLPIILNS